METVWIAGASRGLGAALARVAAARGHRLILSARNEQALRELRDTLPNPEAAVLVPADFSRTNELPALIDRVWSLGVDRVFFCAGLAQWSDPLSTSADTESRLFAVNYLFPVRAAQWLAERMLTRGSGHLIAVGSIAGEFGQAESAAYGASKAALERHFEAFHAAWEPRGIRVQLMQPGVLQTSIMHHALTDSGAAWGDRAKRHVGQNPEHVAERMWQRTASRTFKSYLISPTERVALLLHRWFPALFYTLLRRRHGTA